MNPLDRFLTWITIEAPFLVAIVGGAAVKIALSADLTWRQRAITGFIAVWIAWTFTDPVMQWGQMDAGYKAAVAAVLALTGEGIARIVVNLVSDREALIEAIRAWRGK